jgi:hypothetical protein
VELSSPRFWRTRSKWVALTSVVLTAVVVVGLVETFSTRSRTAGVEKAAPIGAALIALASLLVAAINVATAASRGRKQATVDVWTKWSDSTVEARKALTRLLGQQALTAAQAQGFVERQGVVPGANGQPLTSEQRAEAANAMIEVLNGLERVSVGVEMGVYDLATLRALGGTIVVREYTRFSAYIVARQTAQLPAGQARVFIALANVSDLLERRSIVDKKQEIDRRRIKRLGGSGG